MVEKRLVQSLVREGVEVVFGIPGIHMSGIVAALRDEPSIRMVTTRSEQAALVCISGDGGFMYNAMELSTAVQHGINVTTIVFRDDSYGNVARDLEEFFGGAYGTDLANPDLVKFAESFGTIGMRAGDPLDLATLLPAALECEGPVVIDVPSAGMELPRPKMIAHIATVPWTLPQEGLITS